MFQVTDAEEDVGIGIALEHSSIMLENARFVMTSLLMVINGPIFKIELLRDDSKT